MNTGGFEIERKYLIRYPDLDALRAKAECSYITQTYLADGRKGCSQRVRERRYEHRTEYTHTLKTRISAIRRAEQEREISQTEYLRLLKMADPARRPIEKIRFCLKYKGNLFEVDVYPFWTDRAVMEIELTDESMGFEVPPEIDIIKEVSEDKRYTNASLAMSIPMDNIAWGTSGDVIPSGYQKG